MELVEQKSCDDTHYIANGPQAGIQPPTLHVVTKLKTASLSPTLSPGRHRRLGAVVDQVVDELFGEKVRFLIWPGKNFFGFGGILMTGAHPYQLAISFALLIMTWVVFIAVILPFVHSVPFYQASSLLFSVNILSFFSTAFTDPGIYVRRKVGVVDMFKDELETIHDEYCSLCSVLRLKRTRHCKYCNNCVDVFDHHCPWLGNCIGVRNYPQYFACISSICLSLMIMIFTCMILLLGWFFEFPSQFFWFRNIAAMVFGGWTLFVFALMGSLLVLHIHLVRVGKTTGEFLRAKRRAHREASLNASNLANEAPLSAAWKENILSRATAVVGYLLNGQTGCRNSGRWTKISSPDKRDEEQNNAEQKKEVHETEDKHAKDESRATWWQPTKLLPMWQYENDEDIQQQREISEAIFERFHKELFRSHGKETPLN